jgi:mRNA interferase MazF
LPKQQLDEPREGDIWDVSLGPGRSPEQTGVRPALVLSNDWFNGTENYLHIIVPITGTDRGILSQYRVSGREGGLSKNSVIMCEQVRSISTQRFLKKRGRVSQATIDAVRAIVDMCVGEISSAEE